jgi:hypothetical protein
MKRIQMNEPTIVPIARHAVASPTANLFMWRGNGIVLIGTYEDNRWILARAWLQGDRLEYVRRWSFAQPIRFSRQVRRLITEANDNVALARDEGMRALAWAETAS